MAAQGPNAVPLTERLHHREGSARPPGWLTPQPVTAEPMFSATDQLQDAPNPLDDPGVRADIEAARERAEKEGFETGKERAAELAERLTASIAELDRASERGLDILASELVELALVVAREVVGHELRRDPGPLVTTVREAISSIAEETEVLVKLHPDDLEALGDACSSLGAVKLIAAPDLDRGGCVLETAQRIVDASVEARLDAIRAGLIHLIESERAAEEEQA